MSVHLYTAPAGSGKTAYLVDRARALAAQPGTMLRVVVATWLQVRAWQRRLGRAGGALGVRVGTFDRLYAQILNEAGEVYTRISDPVQYRLLRTLIGEAPLAHYALLRDAPGFVQEVARLIGEWKAGGIFPEALLAALEAMGGEPRLAELAELYLSYQRQLQDRHWADAAGTGWLAAEALERDPQVGADWPALFVDGFDDLTTVQLRVLSGLAGHVGDVIVTLTGAATGRPRQTVHRRFYDTRDEVEAALGVHAELLPGLADRLGMMAMPAAAPVAPLRAPALAHLESMLYLNEEALPPEAEGALSLVAAPDREGEVRAALRWLKQRLIEDETPLAQVALLARDLAPYRAWIVQVAAEYGLPVQLVDGLPLRANPAIAALLDLLQLPGSDAAGGEGAEDRADAAFPWRETVAAWRSPYFDWTTCAGVDGNTIGIEAHDADTLDQVARWGSVVGGLAQWREAFALLAQVGDHPHPPGEGRGGGIPLSSGERPRAWERLDEELPEVPERLPVGPAAEALWHKFERFVQRITPPAGHQSYRAHVRWLESLIGEPTAVRPVLGGELAGDYAPCSDLGVARAAEGGPPETRERDLAALEAMKDVLRGLVWAEEALQGQEAEFPGFLDDLRGAVDAASYRLPLPPDREAILVADVVQARGLSFGAVAVLGLAEGEFPAPLVEDPFLRDADRCRLRDEYGLQLDLSTESAEAGYFYEAITRPRGRLLLTRPRIADNGAPWQASPFWEEVRRRVPVQPVRVTSSQQPAPDKAASWAELVLGVASRWGSAAGRREATGDAYLALQEWAYGLERARFERLAAGAEILRGRAATTEAAPTGRGLDAEIVSPQGSAHDGDLTARGATFAERYGGEHVWSASRLESYRTCPYLFFVSSVLGLEPRAEPSEGLDARQLGNLYHRIMERVYAAVDEPTDLGALLAALPGVAGPILDAAPRREGFRATAWWGQTRREILEHAGRSLAALHALQGSYAPHAFELAFGMGPQAGPALVVRDTEGEQDAFRLRGFIDRVDRAPEGSVRVIDYKTGGPWGYSAREVMAGEKLQLPLYALAAEEALGLGRVADGFYWHVRHANWHLEHASHREWFTLDKVGVREAMDAATAYAWEAVRGARRGAFVPRAPEDGCPSYCPAAGFCPRYSGQLW